MGAIVSYSQNKYMQVAGSTTDTSGGVVIPNGEVIAPFHFRGNGSDPSAYVALVWDYGGASETILVSTRGDISIEFDPSLTSNQFTGNGVKTLNVILINDSGTTSQIIGGAWEAVTL